MNRRERRKMERELGLLDKFKNGSKEQQREIRDRRRKMGKRLHNQTIERVENEMRKIEEDRYTNAYVSLIDAGMSDKEAKDILNNINKVEEYRMEELRMRKIKRKVRN